VTSTNLHVSRWIPVAATLAASALFATSGTARVVSGVEADSVTVAAVRLTIGAIGLLAISSFAGRFSELVRLWRMPLVWIMGAGVAGYQALFFIGTGRVGVAIGTLASLALGPLMAGLLAWALGARRPEAIWWVSTVVAIAGLTVLTLGGLDSSVSIDVLGVLASVGAGSAYSVYTVLGSRLSTPTTKATDVLAASFIIGSVVLIPFGIPHLSELNSGAGLGLSLWLGLAATTAAYVFFGIGITHLAPGTVATLNLAEPVIATIFGVVLLNEVIQGLTAVGCALIALALLILSISTIKGDK
jgi:DME family drug/metabolite transporter